MFSSTRLRSLYINIKWNICIIRSFTNLVHEMKKLNDNKQFKEALDLFHEYEKENNENIPKAAINLALKSSTKIKDFQGGLSVYHRYSFRVEKDPFILPSVIHLLSEY